MSANGYVDEFEKMMEQRKAVLEAMSDPEQHCGTCAWCGRDLEIKLVPDGFGGKDARRACPNRCEEQVKREDPEFVGSPTDVDRLTYGYRLLRGGDDSEGRS